MDDILDYDIETFDELLKSVLRINYHEKTEHAWTLMVASQADQKTMKKWVGQWAKILRGGEDSVGQEKQQGNLDEFLTLMGSGF